MSVGFPRHSLYVLSVGRTVLTPPLALAMGTAVGQQAGPQLGSQLGLAVAAGAGCHCFPGTQGSSSRGHEQHPTSSEGKGGRTGGRASGGWSRRAHTAGTKTHSHKVHTPTHSHPAHGSGICAPFCWHCPRAFTETSGSSGHPGAPLPFRTQKMGADTREKEERAGTHLPPPPWGAGAHAHVGL